MASIAGKVFAITGGASGLGLSTCYKLASLRARALSIGDIDVNRFDEVKKKLRSINPDLQVATTRVDITSSREVNSWIQDTVGTFHELDGAVNCAGTIGVPTSQKQPLFLNETDETWNKVLGLNLTGVLYSMKAEVKAMMELPKRPRSIVNFSSAASLVHDPTIMSYNVSKVGVASLTTILSKDVAPFGIRVNAVSPSATNTGMAVKWYKDEEEAAADAKRRGINFIQQERVADAVTWLLSEDSMEVSGVNIPVGACAP